MDIDIACNYDILCMEQRGPFSVSHCAVLLLQWQIRAGFFDGFRRLRSTVEIKPFSPVTRSCIKRLGAKKGGGNRA